MYRIMIQIRYIKFRIINVHSPHLGSIDDHEDDCFAQIEREQDRGPKLSVKIVIYNADAQVDQDVEFRLIIERFSAHPRINSIYNISTSLPSTIYDMAWYGKIALRTVDRHQCRRSPRYNLQWLKKLNVTETYEQSFKPALWEWLEHIEGSHQ